MSDQTSREAMINEKLLEDQRRHLAFLDRLSVHQENVCQFDAVLEKAVSEENEEEKASKVLLEQLIKEGADSADVEKARARVERSDARQKRINDAVKELNDRMEEVVAHLEQALEPAEEEN